MEALRAEFPSLATVRRPSLNAESAAWAALSALGAAFLASAIAELVLFVAYPLLFPPTREQPVLVPARTLWEAAAQLVAGMIAVRAGGLRALVVYVGYKLVVLLAALPGALYACARDPSFFDRPCDYASSLAYRWPMWLALALGAIAYRLLRPSTRGANRLLRAAGALALGATIGSSLGSLYVFLVMIPSGGPQDVGVTTIAVAGQAIGTIAGSVAAGWLLARARGAAVLLIALALLGPALAYGVPLARMQSDVPPGEPLQLTLQRWSWLWVPAAACVGTLATRALVRARGTFS